MRSTEQEPGLREYLDREAIKDCLMRYARGLDRSDSETLASVFWPEARYNVGTGQEVSGIEFVAMAIPRMREMFNGTMHTLSNMLIELQGNSARVETYLQAYHSLRQANGSAVDVWVGGRYLDRMEKRGDVWKIAHRILVWDWQRTAGTTQDWSACALGIPTTQGSRKPDDYLYQS